MKPTVTPQEVQSVLESKIGRELSSSADFTASVAHFLNAWSFQPEDLSGFARRLEDMIFQEIYARLGRGMRYRSADGSGFIPRIFLTCLTAALPFFFRAVRPPPRHGLCSSRWLLSTDPMLPC